LFGNPEQALKTGVEIEFIDYFSEKK